MCNSSSVTYILDHSLFTIINSKFSYNRAVYGGGVINIDNNSLIAYSLSVAPLLIIQTLLIRFHGYGGVMYTFGDY